MKVTNLAEVKSLEQNVKRFQAVISESSSALSPEVFTMIVLSRLESSSDGLARSIGKAIRDQFVTNNSNRLGRLNNLELVFQIVQKQAADTAIKEEQSRTDDERGGRDYRQNDKSYHSRSRSSSNSSRQQSAQQAHVAQGSGRKEKEQTGSPPSKAADARCRGFASSPRMKNKKKDQQIQQYGVERQFLIVRKLQRQDPETRT